MASKNITVFCDGTWQDLDQTQPTNVSRLARAVRPYDDAGTPQVVRYDNGVGVASGMLKNATAFVGGAFGEGLEDKVMQAYEFICLNYVPGDKLFIFGFSRGAYTARCLAGLLNLAWIVRREHVDEVTNAQSYYHEKKSVPPGAAMVAFNAKVDNFRKQYGYQNDIASIEYVGVWETVGELGIPATLPFASQIDNQYRFFDLNLSALTQSARHAVAIDERRDAYKPTLWLNIDELNTSRNKANEPYHERPYQQQWFPGRHSGVGGGEADQGLSLCALTWIADGAVIAGLRFDETQLSAYRAAEKPDAPFVVENESFEDTIVDNIGGMSDRDGPMSGVELSQAARVRWDKVLTWDPPTLKHVHK